MKNSLLTLSFIALLTSCNHNSDRASLNSNQGFNAEKCTNFASMYRQVSCLPKTIALPDFVKTGHYMAEDEFKNLMPDTFNLKQNGCESLDLSYIRKLPQWNADYTVLVTNAESYPAVHLGIGVDKAVIDGVNGMMFVARWSDDSRDSLMIMRSKNIGFGSVAITDDYGMFTDEDGDSVMGPHSTTSKGFVRVLEHGTSNAVGGIANTLQTCEYREFSIGH